MRIISSVQTLTASKTPISLQFFFESGNSDSCTLMGFLAVVHSPAAAAGSSSDSASTLIFRLLKKWMEQSVV